jgi:hypothetical protein
MKLVHTTLILVLLAGILAGCGGDASTSSVEGSSAASAESESNDAYTSAVMDASYEGALPVSSQLALGIFQLEGTENAVTPAQAAALLPLWQAVQGGTLQSEAETNAVLKQIEGAMTSEQLAAIAAMQLTLEDVGAWAQEQGVSLGPPPEAMGGEGAFGPPGDTSEEERAARRATAEASGMTFGGRRGAGGRGSINFLTEPLIELLTERVAE